MTKREQEEVEALFILDPNIKFENTDPSQQIKFNESEKKDLFTRHHKCKKDMNIIFLDIDGVLNYLPHSPSNSYNGRFINGEEIEPKIIRKFNKIFKEYPDLKIVISSSWRGNMPRTINALRMAGFEYIDNIIGRTPRAQAVHYLNGDLDKPLEPPYTLRHERRSQQILKWLLDNPGISYRLNKFLIIDDEVYDIYGGAGFDFLKDNTLRTDSDKGLTNDDITFIIDYFKKVEK